MSTLDNVRREAKRWLKAIRSGDAEARARLLRAYPHASDDPILRDVQHALARERGHASWREMIADLERQSHARAATVAPFDHTARVSAFLEAACPDCHVVGPRAHTTAAHTAMRLLANDPEIAHDSLFTAVACGDAAAVDSLLRARPAAASEAGGPRNWPPLLYLCNARLPLPETESNAVSIARALLDHGADPNGRYVLHGIEDYPYSALTCVLGRGEEEAPTHRAAEPLARLLLERGAEPYDRQLLYNVFADNSSRSLLADDLVWILEAIHTHALQRGRAADWRDPDWPMLDPWGNRHGAGFLLEAAVDGNHLRIAEWVLAHGAGPDSIRILDGHSTPTPLARALRRGHSEMAALLLRYGATPITSATPADASNEEAFVDACMRLDRVAVTAAVAAHPSLLRSTAALFAAARADRADVAALLLDLGVSPDLEDATRTRALHVAAGSDAASVISLLLDRGAEVDPRESNWNATPLGFAVFGERQRAIDALAPVSRDVFNLASLGRTARLHELFAADPSLAVAARSDGATPLMRLPDDEASALEVIDLFIAHGADTGARSADGQTAADIARERGMNRAAERLAGGRS